MALPVRVKGGVAELVQPSTMGGMRSMINAPKTWVPALEAVLGSFLAFGLVAVALNLHWIAPIPSFGVWGVPTILVLVLGCILYLIRHLFPLPYGVAEIVIGALLVYAATVGAPPGAADAQIYWTLVGKFAAGIYIFVRGLDNISQSQWIADNSWARWFFSGDQEGQKVGSDLFCEPTFC